MSLLIPVQELDTERTTWHITIGAYGSRLHGWDAPTVDRQHNQRGTLFLGPNPRREAIEQDRMHGDPVWFSDEQRELIERTVPELCERGGWVYRIAAAPQPPEHNHLHVLLDLDPAVHGKQARRWLKCWLTESLDARWRRLRGGSWWVECGSTKPVKEAAYLQNVFEYILRQRSTPFEIPKES